MNLSATNLALHRLRNHRLLRTDLDRPEDVVSWLGAVQAQEYPDAKWGLGVRMKRTTDAAVEAAIDAGRILRTHVLRATWHFVTPGDLRWMQALTAARVRAAMAPYDRKLELDGRTIARSRTVIERALKGGRHLTRLEIADALAKAGIDARGQRLAHLVMHAELDALICSGPRRGRHFTYALVDERAPEGLRLSGDEALAELTRRFFASHGPATIRDFAWWSSLTVRDAKRGLELLGKDVDAYTVDNVTHWWIPGAASPPVRRGMSIHLVPPYDEYLVAYRDRAFIVPAKRPVVTMNNETVSGILIDGRLAGFWKRSLDGAGARVYLRPFAHPTPEVREALEKAVEGYSRFLGKPVAVSYR